MSRGKRIGRIALAALLGGSTLAGIVPAFSSPAGAAVLDTSEACDGADDTVFEDEDQLNEEANNAADCASGYGFINGKDVDADGEPEVDGSANLTRGQAATITVNVADATGYAFPNDDGSDPFVDDDDPNNPHDATAATAANEGWINGKDVDVNGDGITPDFDSNANVTRGQMVAFFVRMLESLGVDIPAAPATPTYSDVPTTDPFYAEVEAAAALGLIQSPPEATAFNGGNAISRAQAMIIVSRLAQLLVDEGLLAPLGAGGGITVSPDSPAILPVSGTPGTADGELALREYTITVEDGTCDAVDVALIPFTNIVTGDDGTITFSDVDGQANRADGLGGTQARIETVNGVANSTTDGQDYVNNVDVPANGQLTVEVNSQTANQAVVLVAFCDDDNNNQLNLDPVTDEATEVFGLGGVQLIVPEEADDLQAGTAEVMIHVDLVNLFTSGSPFNPPAGEPEDLFNYDDNDEFDYDSGPITLGNLSLEEFKSFLSGVEGGQIVDFDLAGGRRVFIPANTFGPGVPPANVMVVLGDVVDYTYRTDPAGSSSFEIVNDVPDAVTDVAAVIGDPDADQDDEVDITWTEVVNPDVEGYDIFAQEVINDIPTGDWIGPINNDLVEGDSFVGEIPGNPPFEAGDTWQFVVLAQNGEDGSYGPDSNIAVVDIPADDTPLPLVSEETEIVDNGTGGELDDDDVLRIQFQQDVNFAAGATVRIKDLTDGEFATITAGSNAVFQVGPSDTLTITLTADLVPAGGIGGDGIIDIGAQAVIEAATGITAVDGGLGWHLPASGMDDDETNSYLTALAVLGADSLTRLVQGGSVSNENDTLTSICEVDFFADDDDTFVEVDEAPTCSGLDQGDVVQVFDLAGTLLGSAPWDATVGAQVPIGDLPVGTPLVVQFIDDDFSGANTDVPSESVFLFVLGDDPIVGAISLVDEDTLLINWLFPDPPLTQVGPPSNYQVFDSDNTDLVATGDGVDLIDTDNDGLDDAALVDFDANLTDSTAYTLRVAAATVQNANNVPNLADAVPFFTDITDLGPDVELLTGPGVDVGGTTSDNSPTFTGNVQVGEGRTLAGTTYQVFTDLGNNGTPDGPAVDGGAVAVAANGNFSITTANLPDADYLLFVTSTDSEGVSDTDSADFAVDFVPNVAPVVAITSITTTSGAPDANEGESVTVNGTVADANPTTVQISLQGFGNVVGATDTVPAGGGAFSIVFNVPDLGINDVDNVDVTATATDDLDAGTGSDTEVDALDVDDQDAPILQSVTPINTDADPAAEEIALTFNEGVLMGTITSVDVETVATGTFVAECTAMSGSDTGPGTSTRTCVLSAELPVAAPGSYRITLAPTTPADNDDDTNNMPTGDIASPTFGV